MKVWRRMNTNMGKDVKKSANQVVNAVIINIVAISQLGFGPTKKTIEDNFAVII